MSIERDKMVEESKHDEGPWLSPAEEQSEIIDIANNISVISEPIVITDDPHLELTQPQLSSTSSDDQLGLVERSLSAAGAAILSAVLVNPLDVVKTRLQAQAAGNMYSHPLSNMTSRMAMFGPHMLFADLRCSPSCTRAGVHGTVAICPPDCFQYKGTLDVFYKIIRQEGISRLWRGTNAGLALAVPTVSV
nr:Mitochondrial carrier protein MTM1 [Ipomoea batatas]